MASGSQNMTTYKAKRVIGDASAAQANSALLQTGADVAVDTWILNRTNRVNTYGIKYVYDDTDGHDKIEFYGGAATASAWVQLDTGNTYVAGKLGINYNPGTSGNTYQLYVNGSSYFTDTITGDALSTWHILGGRPSNTTSFNTYFETVGNLHHDNPARTDAEISYNRFFLNHSDQTNYGPANLNLPVVDQHVLSFGIDNGAVYSRHIAFDIRTNAVYVRARTNNTWGNWEQLVRNTGTWGISITGSSASCTGNAATATQLASAGTISQFYRGDRTWSNQLANYIFNTTDIPEGAANFNATATAHKITFYRNGLTIPYQMDDANDGGLLRVRGTSESDCILELGTWDDSGAGETIQFNYYPTSSRITPTYSVSVPKHSGTLVTTDGHGASGSWGISITGNAATATNADKVDDWHRDDIRKGCLSFTRNINSTNPSNLNNLNDGMAYNYSSTGYWQNAPSGASYGGAIALTSGGAITLGGQFFWDVTHNSSSSTRNLWFRAANNLGWQNDWKQIVTNSGSWSISVTGSSGSCTGNAATATNLVGISLTGGNGNTGGRRLIYTWTINAWSNYRLTFAVTSRHTGAGLVAISVGCNASTVSLANCYAEIKYFGPTGSGGIISDTSYEIYMNSAGTTAYLFWAYGDYNNTSIIPISGGNPSNGTWTENPASYGTLKAQTEINVSSTCYGNAATATKLSNTPNNTTTFLRGDNTWTNTLGGAFTANGTITANGGYLKSTANGNTVTIGSQNTSWCHIQNSANISFYFNRSVHVDGSIYVYNSTHHLDSTAIYAYRWRTTNLELAELDANRMGLCNHGQGAAKGLNVGSLLVSSAWADASHVPANGIYSKGLARFAAGLATGGRVNGSGAGIEIGTDGGIEIFHSSTPFIDFHYQATTADYSVRLICEGANKLKCTGAFYGAVWNDYAECRTVEPDVTAGYVVYETDSKVMMKSNSRMQPGCRVISDTYGICIGETEEARTPIAVTGRVLVYPYRARTEYELGAAVCSAPNGTVDIMTREEIREYPERIIGTVSEIPDYEIWHAGECDGKSDIPVNGRIWIYVR